jgi:hypothetical protein
MTPSDRVSPPPKLLGLHTLETSRNCAAGSSLPAAAERLGRNREPIGREAEGDLNRAERHLVEKDVDRGGQRARAGRQSCITNSTSLVAAEAVDGDERLRGPVQRNVRPSVTSRAIESDDLRVVG